MGGSAFKLCLAAAAVGAGAFTAPATSLRQPTSLGASGHAVIVQNKGGGHGEIGYHLAKALAAKDLDVTIVQDASAKKEALPFKLYDELSATVAWCDMGDAAAVEKACAVDGLTHVYDNFAKSPADAAPMMAAAKSSDAFYAFVSSAGMYTAKGILKEEKKVKDPPTGQREVELADGDGADEHHGEIHREKGGILGEHRAPQLGRHRALVKYLTDGPVQDVNRKRDGASSTGTTTRHATVPSPFIIRNVLCVSYIRLLTN